MPSNHGFDLVSSNDGGVSARRRRERGGGWKTTYLSQKQRISAPIHLKDDDANRLFDDVTVSNGVSMLRG